MRSTEKELIKIYYPRSVDNCNKLHVSQRQWIIKLYPWSENNNLETTIIIYNCIIHLSVYGYPNILGLSQDMSFVWNRIAIWVYNVRIRHFKPDRDWILNRDIIDVINVISNIRGRISDQIERNSQLCWEFSRMVDISESSGSFENSFHGVPFFPQIQIL